MSERTVEALSAELGRIDPPVFPTVERVPVGEGREIIVVAVDPGLARPYQYRGAAYRRVGNTTLGSSANAASFHARTATTVRVRSARMELASPRGGSIPSPPPFQAEPDGTSPPSN